MRIVALDAQTVHPDELDLSPLHALGEVVTYDRTRPEEVLSRAADAEVVLTNKVVLDRTTFEALPRLRYVGVLATGVNVVDLDAARDRGVVVTNVPAYSTDSVAQLTFGLLLTLTHRLDHHVQSVREGGWVASPDFAYWDFPLVELSGRTLGLVGYGSIGQAVARIAAAFGMTVLTLDRGKPTPGATAVSRGRLLAEADVVSLHCPLTPETDRIVDAAWLSAMQRDAFLINTARGRLIDEAALAEALVQGLIAGAGLDVLSVEPPTSENPLLRAPNCVITPHIGWATLAARRRLIEIVAANVRAFLEGVPQNVVNA